MDKKLLTVSLAPHTAGTYSIEKMMYAVIWALMPAMAAALIVFGMPALRVIILAVSSAVVFEYAIQKYMLKTAPRISDGSAIITGLLLAYNLPSHLPWWMVVVGSLVAIAIAKMTFGGLGNNPFNPALVGRVFLLISFPVAMTSWPKPFFNRLDFFDAVTQATPLAVIKEGVKGGGSISHLMGQIPGYWELFVGAKGGCLGEISGLALLIGLVYLLMKKIITWHIPVSMVGTVALLSGLLWLKDPLHNASPLFHVLTGGVLLGAIFMATDYVTSPMTPKGMMIYGAAIGFLTVAIRVFGAYPEGVSFAILIMNAFVPLIDRYCPPKRFGE